MSNIHIEVPDSTNKLKHMKRSAVFQTSLLHLETVELIIFTVTGISLCSPWFKLLFLTVVLDGFLLLMKGSSLTNGLPYPLPFFGLGVTNNADKPDWVLPIGDNGSNGLCSSGELIVEINEAQFSSKLQLFQNANTGNHTLISRKQLIDFLYFRETTC